MILDTTTKLLELVLGEAKTTTDCAIVACWANQTDSAFLPVENDLVSNGTTAVTVVPAPASGVISQINEVRLANNDSVTHTVTLYISNNGTLREIDNASVAPGAMFLYTPETVAQDLAGSVQEWNAGTVDALGTTLAIHTTTLDLAPVAAGDLFANTGTVTAIPSPSTLSQLIDVTGSVQGDVLYRGASAWTALGPGTSGQVLKTGGAAADPSWTNEQWNAGTVVAISPNLTIAAGNTLNLAGSVDISGTLVVGTNFAVDNGGTLLTFNNSGTTLPTISSGSQVQIVGPAGTAAGLELVSYGTAAGQGSTFTGTTFGGTPGSPSGVIVNQILQQFVGRGYDGAALSNTQAAINFRAINNWTTADHSTMMRFTATPTLSVTNTEMMRLTNSRLLINTTTDDGVNNLQVNGSGKIANTATVGTLAVGSATPFSAIGTGLSVTSGTLTAAGSGGTVTQVNTTGAGISGGPITGVGTLAVEWNAGTVSTVGSGLLLSSGTLSAVVAATPTVIAATGSVIVPAGCNHCDAELWGGGGGSGATTGTIVACGSNGGGGGYTRGYFSVTPGDTLTVTIGAGGSGGLGTGTAPTSGGSTIFQGLTAFGGGAGVNGTALGNGTPGGTGGGVSGTGSYVSYDGQDGLINWAQGTAYVIMGGGGSWSFPPVLPNGRDTVGIDAVYPGCAGAPANSAAGGANYDGGNGAAGQAILRFVP